MVEVDAEGLFVELAHYGPKPVDLSGWTLTTGATSRPLPPRTTLSPGRPLVLTPDLQAFQAKYGTARQAVEVSGLALNPRRDTLTLKHGSRVIDTVAWGDAKPGWNLPGPVQTPLCRVNPGKDTNTGLDWIGGADPTPGAAGCGR